jgi:hypothetical protein
MVKITEESFKNPETSNTDSRNEHPIAVLYANKILQLSTGRELDWWVFNPVYDICKERGELTWDTEKRIWIETDLQEVK